MPSKFQIHIGKVAVGGGAPVSVQSMTNTDTRDAEATLGQIRSLATYGCEIVRVAVPDETAAAALKSITAESPLPVVADIHFKAQLAIASVAAGAAALRINPGNIGSHERVGEIIEAAREADIPIRIGVNAGSLPSEKRAQAESNAVAALVETVLDYVNMFEEMDFRNFKVSAKSSSVSSQKPTIISVPIAMSGFFSRIFLIVSKYNSRVCFLFIFFKILLLPDCTGKWMKFNCLGKVKASMTSSSM